MKKSLLKSMLVFGTVAAMLVGCGSGNAQNQVENQQEAPATITVTDVRGEVEIPADPQRIVDLSGNSDILEILGYDVIGTANSDAYDYTKFPSYLEETLDYAISKHCCQGKFLEAIWYRHPFSKEYIRFFLRCLLFPYGLLRFPAQVLRR